MRRDGPPQRRSFRRFRGGSTARFIGAAPETARARICIQGDVVTEERRCVQCRRRPVAPQWRPFCSERCKLLDLGNWIDERYRVPSEPTATGNHDPIGGDQGS